MDKAVLKGEILRLLSPVIMIYNGSTRQLEVVDQFEECFAVEIYIESLVDPLLKQDFTKAYSQYSGTSTFNVVIDIS